MSALLPFLLALVPGVDSWVASRDASVAAWLSDQASSLTPTTLGTMDAFESMTFSRGTPGPSGLEDGVLRRRRTSLSLQGNPADSQSNLRYGAAWLWDAGGWHNRLTWSGDASRRLDGSTWAWGALAAWRPGLQTGGGVVIRQRLAGPDSVLAERSVENWALLRVSRLSLAALGDRSHQSWWELAWQVDPDYSPEDEGMLWREFSLGVRRLDDDRNAWAPGRELQVFGSVPLWRDQLRLLWQVGTKGRWERATLQSDLLPQGLAGFDLSYARTRWASRDWGLRLRFLALSLGWNDPEDIRDLGPNGGSTVLSARMRIAFDGANDYYTPGRHRGPQEQISQTTRQR